MATTIESLKAKIAHLQQELAEVIAGLDELQNGVYPPQGERELLWDNPDDRAELIAIARKSFAEMGLGDDQSAMTPVEVQQLMLKQGIKPEDNIFSRGIIEMREE